MRRARLACREGARRRRARSRRFALAGALAAALIAVLLWQGALRAKGVVVRPRREKPSDYVCFYQEDEAWRHDAMGRSGRTLGKDGDSVACLASMLAARGLTLPTGEAPDPGTLNAWLSGNGGYDRRGNLRWRRVGALLGMRAVEKPPGKGLGALLDRLTQDERSAIVRVRRPDVGRMHDVLVVGSVHGEYTIVDPLDPTNTLNTLGLYRNRIYSVRYLE